ncbi:UNVERIFIED_CONTAM: hypothetical protein Sindi_1670600, partial [Sesamum indicum]
FSLANASSSLLPAGDGETAGEAPADSDGDGTVAGCRTNNHGRRVGNQAVRVEDERSGFLLPTETAVLPPAEGSPRVPLGVDGRTTEKGGRLRAEIVISDPTIGGDASSNNVNGGPSSSSFNLDEFLNLACRVIDHGDEAAMDALNELKNRWKKRFGDNTKPRQTTTMEGGRERPVTGGLRKALRCLIPLDPAQATGRNSGKAPASLQLPATVTVRARTTASGGNGVSSCRPANLEGRKVAGNASAAARPLGAFFRPFGERTEPSPATGDVCRKSDVDAKVDTPGADVAADVGDKEGEVEHERAAYISLSRADVILDASRADVIHDAKAEVIHEARADVIHDTRADVILEARADVIHPRADITNFMGEKKSNLGKKSTPVPLFIGNIPLHTGSNGITTDKIADAFNNSSRKTLSFIAPTIQNGEVVVRPSLDTVRDGAKRWKSTAEFAHLIWPALREVTATANGFFFFRFKTEIDMEEVIEGGPWLFQGQPIVLQKWEPGMAMRKLKHTQVPVWIKMPHLPLEFWTTEGLSTVASGVGKPLYPDAITRACTRLDFARVCVMIDVTQKLEKHIIIMTPDEDGGETPCKVDIEYEWLPPKCTGCMTLGHSVKECSLTNPQKQTKPPVKVYVPKANVPPPPPVTEERVKKHKTVVVVEDKEKGDEGTKQNKRYNSSQKEKGKEVATFNPFDALNSLDDAEENTRGPITYSPSSSDPC